MRHLGTAIASRPDRLFFRQGRAEFCFDSRHTLAKFVEFVAARFAETNSHQKGGRRTVLRELR
jgi:hypothetical protein